MFDSNGLLAELERYLHQRGAVPQSMGVEQALLVMADWFRLHPLPLLAPAPGADALLFRYGAWSEGCATGFNVGVLRQVRQPRLDGGVQEWMAGITVIFEPSRYRDLEAFALRSDERPTLEAFLAAVRAAPGYRATVGASPMTVAVENGALR